MKLRDAEALLPNGLHDSYLLSFKADYETQVAEFSLNVWVGDLSSKQTAVRQKYQRAKLIIKGLHFLVVEAPYQPDEGDLGVPDLWGFGASAHNANPTEAMKKLLKMFPSSAFYEVTLVNSWNSYIHICAEEAEILMASE